MKNWEKDGENLEELKTLGDSTTNNSFSLNFDSCLSFDHYLMNGSPEDSNMCINELFKKDCNISNYCWYSEMNRRHHSGKELFKKNYFPMAQDIFLEQIALCGYEGYVEFASDNWRKIIRNWQKENGCFGEEMFSIDCSNSDYSYNRNKKTDSVVNKCHTHVTAVALAAMSFHLRHCSALKS
ncbi:hypothetical protein Phum_PHUM422820 [Pediculus humanus corporis]|uniref:Uncharacterized protein n=1 Tax=Pediculus humanus subsp. corporis TaxID=121224 RepID=E0VSS1_PEDHC|nr:uncharacterized protein Phum_PHUM422820 [Pediculus humanus corporis]EEB16427.1 hypothetical protein Phum_PHUM422820 [Pediculus humanus corporis]